MAILTLNSCACFYAFGVWHLNPERCGVYVVCSVWTSTDLHQLITDWASSTPLACSTAASHIEASSQVYRNVKVDGLVVWQVKTQCQMERHMTTSQSPRPPGL